MSVIIIFYLISVTFGAIPIDELNLNVISSNSTIYPEFETQLREALQTEKNFFARDEVTIANTALTAGIAIGIGLTAGATVAAFAPLVAILPIVQLALSRETDFKEPLINVITSVTKRQSVEGDLFKIETESKLIFKNIRKINKYLNDSNEKSDESKMHIISLVTLIQDHLETILAIYSSGDSKFWEYPQLAVHPLLGLTLLISRFAPVRDIILKNEFDESIISCQLTETLQSYFPKILRWRLKQLYPGYGYEDQITPKINTVLNHPEFFISNGKSVDTDNKNIRCIKLRCDAVPYHCFMDKLQGDISITEEKIEGHNYKCLYDYLLLLRSRVTEIFDDAIDVMNGTCSSEMRTRNREKSGKY